MKKVTLIFILSLFVHQLSFAQDTQSGAQLVFFEDRYDFGEIKQGEKVSHVFEFENAGIEPLILIDVRTTCGCTASDWPRQPIMPGQIDSITVTFDSTGKSGINNKTITVVSNAGNQMERIVISVNVLTPGT